MKRIFQISYNKFNKINIENYEGGQALAEIVCGIANDFKDQLDKLTNKHLNLLGPSNEEYLIINQRLNDIQSIIEMMAEFYIMQAEYIKNNNSEDNTTAPSVCKKTISIMLSFQIDYSSIPYELFRSPYEWLLYISLLATFPKQLKDRVEIVAEYKDKSFNYFNDICIVNKLTNNLVVRIECDGKKNHYDTEQNYERQCIRQNNMMIHDDYKILRYPNRKIYYENFNIANQIWNFVLKQYSNLELIQNMQWENKSKKNTLSETEIWNSVWQRMQDSKIETENKYKSVPQQTLNSKPKQPYFTNKIKSLFRIK